MRNLPRMPGKVAPKALGGMGAPSAAAAGRMKPVGGKQQDKTPTLISMDLPSGMYRSQKVGANFSPKPNPQRQKMAFQPPPRCPLFLDIFPIEHREMNSTQKVTGLCFALKYDPTQGPITRTDIDELVQVEPLVDGYLRKHGVAGEEYVYHMLMKDFIVPFIGWDEIPQIKPGLSAKLTADYG